MQDAKKVLSPGTIENMTGVSVDAQRDWRHKGALDLYGTAENGRWKYSLQDAAALWMAARLVACGWGRNIAGPNAWYAAPRVISYLRGAPLEKRYVGFCITGEKCPGGGDMLFKHEFDTLDHLTDASFERVDLIDFRQIADAIPADLREILVDAKDW